MILMVFIMVESKASKTMRPKRQKKHLPNTVKNKNEQKNMDVKYKKALCRNARCFFICKKGIDLLCFTMFMTRMRISRLIL